MEGELEHGEGAVARMFIGVSQLRSLTPMNILFTTGYKCYRVWRFSWREVRVREKARAKEKAKEIERAKERE